MFEGRIHSIETCGTVDGPGIRFILFLQGCLMRCKYCHNRDSWDEDGGYVKTVSEVMDEIRPYKHFFRANGGGVTASGGEAILQAEFVTELFKQCKAEGIHTCLDTNGFVRNHNKIIDDLLDVTDLVMLDLKQINDKKHIDLTKVSNRYAMKFAKHLQEIDKPTWIRYVIVPGHSDDIPSAKLLADFIEPMKNVERLELLPYHAMGEYKWEQFGEKYELDGISPPSRATMKALGVLFEGQNINVIF